MSAFTYVELEEGEVIVIGPVTFSSSSSVSFSAGGTQSTQVNRAKQRKIGITNRRVIVEGDSPTHGTYTVANIDVKRVYLKRKKLRSQLEKIETSRGQTVKLELRGIGPTEEAQLFELFPNAEIGEKKGLFGRFSRLTPPPTPSRQTPTARPSSKRIPPAAKPAPPATGWTGQGRSHVDDADIETLDDLRRYYPLPEEYDYDQTEEGEYRVKRLSDGVDFPILVEADMLGFDVPIQDPKRRKITIEIIKKR